MANRQNMEDLPKSEKFLKRVYKKDGKKRKKTLRDHRRACMKST